MAKILINGLLLREQHSGVQYSIENLIEGLLQEPVKNHDLALLVSPFYKPPFNEDNRLTIKRLDMTYDSRIHRVLFEHLLLGRYLKKQGVDIYHAPGYILPYFLRAKAVVTVHDLIALDFPELCQYETAAYFRLTLPASIKRADKIIAVSQTVKRDILNRFPTIAADKIRVIYPGVHGRFHPVTDAAQRADVRKTYGLPSAYFLFVGNLEPKKNLEMIVEAFKRLKTDKQIDHKLVIVGKLGWKYKGVLRAIQYSGLKDEIMLLGYVDEKHLPSIYSMASVFVFPSLYEGFGIPVVEAMRCGCPVIVSDRGALPEIAGAAAKQVDPLDAEDIAEAMYQLTSNEFLRQDMIERGLQWSQKFTWQQAAQQTLTVYNDLT
ncbi:glycosyltransferase family 4 protein [Sphingobacterium paludis]|uniref:Glycosyltransferase involved in cell wall biosynthesis n=1 Tax=Sphingobacterium paludis TaxID=1476465 RepID=A0A4R7D0N0_9SPHI|nr:glycosyltransferase family 1 protein [Sphingobacterium paludis]TDS13867.1 glycosyltransferase involved in cell wall biosynthesis [Sphingobacterium paludis]